MDTKSAEWEAFQGVLTVIHEVSQVDKIQDNVIGVMKKDSAQQ